MGKAKNDPMAKRRDETHLQWRARVAAAQETARKAGEGIVPPEALAKGHLVEAFSPDQERARTYRIRSTSSLARLNQRGVISDDQHAAAQEIAMVAERIGRDVSVTSASYTGRVDCDSSGRDAVAEGLYRVRIERAYSDWRLRIPRPRGMLVAMVVEDHALAAIAARHGRNWRRAIVLLRDALDLWDDCKNIAFRRIEQDDVDRALRRIA